MNDASRGRVAWLLRLAQQKPDERDEWLNRAAQHMVKDFGERKG